MAQTMRAAVLEAPGRFVLRQVPRPEPRPGQVRIRVEGCGVCGSDLAPYEGRAWFEYPRLPGQPGHEAWGVVDAVGRGVPGPREGKRVAVLAHAGYAEFAVADASTAVPVPAEVGEQPFPGEALACAMNAFRRSDIGPGDVVVVVGIGFLGACILALARAAGARTIAVSRREYALKAAEQMGAHHVVRFDDPESVLVRVEELTGGRLADRVVEATGKQAPLDLAARLTRVRGRLVIVGYHQDGPRSVDMQLWNWRGIDVVNAHERDPREYVRGMRLAAEAIAHGRLDPSPLYTGRYGLEGIAQAFEAMRTRPEGHLKAVVQP